MDYALPRADVVPGIEVGFHPVPATTNPLGVKGCGEAGVTGALPAVMNAVLDALAIRWRPPSRHAGDARASLAGAADRGRSDPHAAPRLRAPAAAWAIDARLASAAAVLRIAT